MLDYKPRQLMQNELQRTCRGIEDVAAVTIENSKESGLQ